MAQQNIRDHFLGTTLGLAVGDAVGQPWIGQNRVNIETQVDQIKAMMGGSNPNQPRGSWTSDVAQMMAVLEACCAGREFDAEDVAYRISALHMKGLLRAEDGLGGVYSELDDSPEEAVANARRLWTESAGTICSGSSLARCVVVALRNPNDLEQMIAETIQVCAITHADPRCIDGAIALNFLIIQCLHGRFSRNLISQTIQFIDHLCDDPVYTSMVAPVNADQLRRMKPLTGMPGCHEDKDAIIRALKSIETLSSDDLGATSYVAHSFTVAVWSMFHARSFEDGVVRAVMPGGETATQGGLAGALLGARFGLNNIPTAWLKPLQERARIASLTEILFGMVEDSFGRG